MPDAIVGYLDREMECEGLLECFYGLKRLDREVFRVLRDAEPLTVDEIADRVNRERSTAYRSVNRLVEAGVVVREQRTYDDGGYYHVFQLADPETVTDQFHRTLNDWYAQMGQLIGEFEEKYDTPESTTSQ